MEPMIASCGHCGGPFIARRLNAEYCGPTCRQRARRGRLKGRTAPAERSTPELPAPLTYASAFLDSVAAKFEQVGRKDDPLALLALSLAEQAMQTDLAPAVRCSITATFRKAYVDAMRGVRTSSRDELSARRQRGGL